VGSICHITVTTVSSYVTSLLCKRSSALCYKLLENCNSLQ